MSHFIDQLRTWLLAFFKPIGLFAKYNSICLDIDSWCMIDVTPAVLALAKSIPPNHQTICSPRHRSGKPTTLFQQSLGTNASLIRGGEEMDRISRLLAMSRRLRPGNEAKNSDPVPEIPDIEEPLKGSYGLEVLVQGQDPIVDIIAIHGLNGHRERSWTAGNGKMWLRDFLPNDIPNARIITYGYNADTHSRSELSSQFLYDHATSFMSDLSLMRRKTQTERRPIIFVAHSLGGIVVKSALIHGDSCRRGQLEHHRLIKESTYGILFFGTPHQGGEGVSLGKLIVNVGSIFLHTDSRILKHLARDSEWLQQQLGQYLPISTEFVTKFFYEVYATPLAAGKTMVIVPKPSAVVPGQVNSEAIAINKDHREMIRFSSKDENDFRKVSDHLSLMMEDAPRRIESRWH